MAPCPLPSTSAFPPISTMARGGICPSISAIATMAFRWERAALCRFTRMAPRQLHANAASEQRLGRAGTVVPIPVYDLRPFSNTLTLNFAFQAANDGSCAAAPPANMQGASLKDSYLDLTGIPHWTSLPTSSYSPTRAIPSPAKPTSPTRRWCFRTSPPPPSLRCFSP